MHYPWGSVVKVRGVSVWSEYIHTYIFGFACVWVLDLATSFLISWLFNEFIHCCLYSILPTYGTAQIINYRSVFPCSGALSASFHPSRGCKWFGLLENFGESCFYLSRQAQCVADRHFHSWVEALWSEPSHLSHRGNCIFYFFQALWFWHKIWEDLKSGLGVRLCSPVRRMATHSISPAISQPSLIEVNNINTFLNNISFEAINCDGLSSI